MSIDKSLKVKNALVRQRNVLKREERIAQLQRDGKWEEDASPYGLAKTRVFKVTAGAKKKKKEKEEGEETTEGGE